MGYFCVGYHVSDIIGFFLLLLFVFGRNSLRSHLHRMHLRPGRHSPWVSSGGTESWGSCSPLLKGAAGKLPKSDQKSARGPCYLPQLHPKASASPCPDMTPNCLLGSSTLPHLHFASLAHAASSLPWTTAFISSVGVSRVPTPHRALFWALGYSTGPDRRILPLQS